MVDEKISGIINIMSDIEYGFKDELGNNIIDFNPKKWDDEFEDFYYLQTPEELLKTKCGVCWDQVELERDLFVKADIEIKTFFVYMVDGDMLPSHTFLTYINNNKFCWFEHSWFKYRGIHEYNSERELFLDIINKFKMEHNYVSKEANLYLYEYQEPKKHIKCNEFYQYIETQNRVDL